MQFLINELSFVGQAKNAYEAYELLKELYDIIKEIKPIQKSHPIQTHSSFSTQKILSDLSIYKWLYSSIKSTKENERILAKFFIQILTKGPFIDLQGLLESCQCYFNENDVTSSSLTGAAKIKGILLSLQQSPHFVGETIKVRFREGEQPTETVTIQNLVQISHARKLCPRYTGSPKHDSSLRGTAPSVQGTEMDLTKEKAQEVLNHSIEYRNKRYGYHREKNRYYVFHPNNSSDSEGHPLYHGFPISDREVPSNIKAKVTKLI